MPRFKKPYTLYARSLRDGQVVWYYQTYDEHGKRTVGRSTGEANKTKADQYCSKLIREGKLVPQRYPTLREWAAERHWWEWDLCLYVKGRLARSDPEKPALGRRYVDDALRTLKQKLLPEHGEKRLNEITPEGLEALLFKWASAGYSYKSINNYASVYRTMLSEAARIGKVDANPWEKVPSFSASSKPRGLLTREEARVLLDPRTVETVWSGHQLYYLVNLLAAATGLRQGECLALRKENLHPDHIRVAFSWSIKYHLGRTKNKTIADIPIPNFLHQELVRFAVWPGYVFSFTGGESPATGNRATEALYVALEQVGIQKHEQAERNLTFHSWRKFFNTYLRSRNISDAKIRSVTRHLTPAMTDHYTSFALEDFREVYDAQTELVDSLVKE